MREAGIGRVLVASLHQGIADILPTRLGFYENWLNAEGLREGTIGLAPLYAVLSFLRQEGEAYQMITTRAGEYAAEWTVESMSPVAAIDDPGGAGLAARPAAAAAGARPRARAAISGSRVISRLRRGTASIDVRASIFCTVREPVPHPLCGFYAAAFTRLLALFDLHARAEVVACRGTGEADLRAPDRDGRRAEAGLMRADRRARRDRGGAVGGRLGAGWRAGSRRCAGDAGATPPATASS